MNTWREPIMMKKSKIKKEININNRTQRHIKHYTNNWRITERSKVLQFAMSGKRSVIQLGLHTWRIFSPLWKNSRNFFFLSFFNRLSLRTSRRIHCVHRRAIQLSIRLWKIHWQPMKLTAGGCGLISFVVHSGGSLGQRKENKRREGGELRKTMCRPRGWEERDEGRISNSPIPPARA